VAPRRGGRSSVTYRPRQRRRRAYREALRAACQGTPRRRLKDFGGRSLFTERATPEPRRLDARSGLAPNPKEVDSCSSVTMRFGWRADRLGISTLFISAKPRGAERRSIWTGIRRSALSRGDPPPRGGRRADLCSEGARGVRAIRRAPWKRTDSIVELGRLKAFRTDALRQPRAAQRTRCSTCCWVFLWGSDARASSPAGLREAGFGSKEAVGPTRPAASCPLRRRGIVAAIILASAIRASRSPPRALCPALQREPASSRAGNRRPCATRTPRGSLVPRGTGVETAAARISSGERRRSGR
jgi:hypothetical protein